MNLGRERHHRRHGVSGGGEPDEGHQVQHCASGQQGQAHPEGLGVRLLQGPPRPPEQKPHQPFGNRAGKQNQGHLDHQIEPPLPGFRVRRLILDPGEDYRHIPK